MDSPSLGIGWMEMQRAVIHGLEEILEEVAVRSKIGPPWGRLLSALPPPHTHTQLLSFLLTELFFLILIPGGFKAKIIMKGKGES